MIRIEFKRHRKKEEPLKWLLDNVGPQGFGRWTFLDRNGYLIIYINDDDYATMFRLAFNEDIGGVKA